MTRIEVEALFTGGNRQPASAAWHDATVAFGAGCNIALWSPDDKQSRGVRTLLRGHIGTVNAVKFLHNEETKCSYIISGSADKTVRLWKPCDESNIYDEVACLQEHTASINTIAVSGDQNTFVSGAADGTVRTWRLAIVKNMAKVSLVQTLTMSPHFIPMAIAIVTLHKGMLALAVAGTTANIHIFTTTNDHFTPAAVLAGHEGWIRSLDFVHETSAPDSDILLASASQDKYIRLWRIHLGSDLPAMRAADNEDPFSAESKTMTNKAYYIGDDNNKHSITFEALLVGHEDWIYSASWQTDRHTAIRLLTASADNSLSIWEREENSGLWVATARLGEISAQKGSTSATGSVGGFWNGLWKPDGTQVICLGRTGSWRRWTHDRDQDQWMQSIGVSGHVKEVKSIAWASDGSHLLSTGSDQTTRLFAQWTQKRDDSWHEMTRPQIHGYDLNCIAAVGARQFVSGADEKLLRVFRQPRTVANMLSTLTGASSVGIDAFPESANVPVLGLSNKAINLTETSEDAHEDDAQELAGVDEAPTAPVVPILEVTQPPTEDQLARHTLWPEHEKLYGHGYEICALAASHDAKVIATACRASSLDHAVMRLYETNDWRELKPTLAAHTLTVTSLAFAPDDSYLLSVGRDRQWALFKRVNAQSLTYAPHKSNPKGHARMILDCSWAPLSAGIVFATAGRDKCIKIWKQANDSAEVDCVLSISHAGPVTAVAFEASDHAGLCLASGLEDGTIHVSELDTQTLQLIRQTTVEGHAGPSATVNKLAWLVRNSQHDMQQGRLLAAASDDTSVRIYRVDAP